jgi:hypothetical protein
VEPSLFLSVNRTSGETERVSDHAPVAHGRGGDTLSSREDAARANRPTCRSGVPLYQDGGPEGVTMGAGRGVDVNEGRCAGAS